MSNDAEIISNISGQSISHCGAWLLVQRLKERISAEETAKVKEVDSTGGKGNPYVDILSHHMPMLDALQTNARKAFRKAFCG